MWPIDISSVVRVKYERNFLLHSQSAQRIIIINIEKNTMTEAEATASDTKSGPISPIGKKFDNPTALEVIQ